MMTEPRTVVIVGASAAGFGAADGLREGGYAGPITILTSEPRPGYDRPTLSKSLLEGAEPPALRQLRTPDHIAAKGFDVRVGVDATGVDVANRVVHTSTGEDLPFDGLVIATGSNTRTITTDLGEELPVMRTSEDLERVRAGVNAYDDIAVIGSGFIGLEVAASMRKRGKNVTLFGALPVPLNDIVGEVVAGTVRDLHHRHGVDMRSSTLVTAVTGERGDYTIHYNCVADDGTSQERTHQAPFVTAGIGVTPTTAWLEGSGLELDNGVLTDAAGRTNVEGIWAAGDVAYFEHPLYGERVRVHHWTNAVEQGRAVGLNMARGTATAYAGIPYFWTDQFERKYHYLGRRRPADECILAEGSLDEDEFLVLYGSGDEFHAIASSGCMKSLRGYKKLLAKGASLTEARALGETNRKKADAGAGAAAAGGA